MTWEQENYDPFGNRWVPTYSSTLPPLTLETATAQSWFNAANNRVNTWGYDGAGNVTSIQGMQRTFLYDGENRQTTATINGSPTTYTYDGEGRRVTKTVSGGAITTYVYDAMAHLVAEYNGPVAASGTTYITQDHLGSTRLITSSTGAILNCYDYFPFGGDIPAGVNGRPSSCYPAAPNPADWETIKFTSKERDSETGLDYFGARYFSSAQGRFTSPDPKMMSNQRMRDPQQWNAYAYTRNNPLQFVDPDGKEIRLAPGADASKIIPALVHAYTKSDFRPMFDKLASSKNIIYITNGDVKQDAEKMSHGTVTEGTNIPKPADPSKPISNTNVANTITLDNTYVFGSGVTDYGKDFPIGHEFDHAVKIDSDPAGQIAAHNDPAGQKAQEDAANKTGDTVGKEKPSMSPGAASQAVNKALGCSTDSSGKTTCK